MLRALARIRVTVAYAVILTGVATTLVALGPRVQNRVISHASTNLHNLSHCHLGTLFVSAFVIEAGPIYVWLPGLMCLLALAARGEKRQERHPRRLRGGPLGGGGAQLIGGLIQPAERAKHLAANQMRVVRGFWIRGIPPQPADER